MKKPKKQWKITGTQIAPMPYNSKGTELTFYLEKCLSPANRPYSFQHIVPMRRMPSLSIRPPMRLSGC